MSEEAIGEAEEHTPLKASDFVNLPSKKMLIANISFTLLFFAGVFGLMSLMAPTLILWTIATLLVITFCVVIHEGGHYLTAKKFGMMVSEFAIGFGPILAYRESGDMIWSIRAIPMGGYVRIMGMTVEEQESEGIPREQSFIYKTPLQRFIVGIAGVAVNMIAAFLAMSVVRGFVHAYNGGLRPIDALKIPVEAIMLMFNVISLTLGGLGKLVTNFFGSEVGTVLMMPSTLEQASTSPVMNQFPGFLILFVILAMLNVSLAVFNILPFFPLDGGHLVLAVADKIRNMRAKSKKLSLPEPLTLKQVTWYRVGTMVFVFAMMIGLLGRDLYRIFT